MKKKTQNGEDSAPLNLISGLAEGQVLQRSRTGKASTRLTGTCQEDGELRVTIHHAGKALLGWKQRRAGKVRAGQFDVTLRGIPAGGPYALRLEVGKLRAELKEFFVGDVWILAGQSNMEGAAKISPAARKPHPLVRAFSQARFWRLATDPLHVHMESPDVCHNYGNRVSAALADAWRQRAVGGAGVGISFGREMLKRSGVPQGLICTARGGSSMSLWDPNDPAQLYASMLASVRATGQPVAGVLWYQGESDTSAGPAAVYTERMLALVAALRRDLSQPRLPWLMVQLARVYRLGAGTWWNNVQEQQRLLPTRIADLACVPAIDLSLDDEIHVDAQSFRILGERLARAADRLVYANRHEKMPPTLASIQRTIRTEQEPAPKCGIDVFFDGIEGPLQAAGEPGGFSLVDQAGFEVPWIFKTTLHGTFVRLHLMRQPPEGTRLSYGLGHAPHCNINDARGMALPVFAEQPIEPGTETLLPFLTTWRVSKLLPPEEAFERLEIPSPELWLEPKTYAAGFIDEHQSWQRQSGYAFFRGSLTMDVPGRLQFLMGYDGPFRVWLNGKPFFIDPDGTNPCIADQSGKAAKLKAGQHDIVVAMDINFGRSWGFFLRFRQVEKAERSRKN